MSKPMTHFDAIRHDDLMGLYELTRTMSRLEDDADILRTVLKHFVIQIGAEVGAFIYYNIREDAFEVRMIESTLTVHDTDNYFSQTIFRKILKTREALLSFDTQSDTEYSASQSVVINHIHAILAFPLIINDQVYGIMYFDSRHSRQKFTEASRQLLTFFAPIASLTLAHALRGKAMHRENVALKKLLPQKPLPDIIGESRPMQQLTRLVHKVAPTDASVLILGENGVGKDLVARAIHRLSSRHNKPYLAQFVGNLPASILESELFGYKKGAFTGANEDKMGLFEAVHGGTLFLDEISELSMDLQAKLLRVLQNKEIKRLGENTIRKVDVRIIAASNKDLKQLIREGKFRDDLYYRLNVIAIKVPPLRDRREDIPLLARHIIRTAGDGSDKKISQAALKKLMVYNWPGNVRQLENVLQRALIISESAMIEEEDIVLEDEQEAENMEGTMEELKNRLIRERIRQFNGNKTLAAKSLDISLRSLQMKARELGL
ncbi:MAG: GAF domain-containing protein [Calditrichaeota bacterium]|nr:MAG: GAF domain-containing protein [Calditrichota bacterium]